MPEVPWMSEKMWGEICRVEAFHGYENLHMLFTSKAFLR